MAGGVPRPLDSSEGEVAPRQGGGRDRTAEGLGARRGRDRVRAATLGRVAAIELEGRASAQDKLKEAYNTALTLKDRADTPESSLSDSRLPRSRRCKPQSKSLGSGVHDSIPASATTLLAHEPVPRGPAEAALHPRFGAPKAFFRVLSGVPSARHPRRVSSGLRTPPDSGLVCARCAGRPLWQGLRGSRARRRNCCARQVVSRMSCHIVSRRIAS